MVLAPIFLSSRIPFFFPAQSMMKKKRSLSLCVCVSSTLHQLALRRWGAPAGYWCRSTAARRRGPAGPGARQRRRKSQLAPGGGGHVRTARWRRAPRLASPFPSLSRPRAWTDHLSRRDPHIPFQIRPHPTFIFFTRLAVLQIDKSMLFQSRAAYLMSASGFSKNFCTRLQKLSRHLSFSSLSPFTSTWIAASVKK